MSLCHIDSVNQALFGLTLYRKRVVYSSGKFRLLDVKINEQTYKLANTQYTGIIQTKESRSAKVTTK